MRTHTNRGSQPGSAGPALGGLAALLVIGVLSWVFWPRTPDESQDDPGTPALSAVVEGGEPASGEPASGAGVTPQAGKQEADWLGRPPEDPVQEARDRRLAEARARLDAVRKGGDDEAVRQVLGVLVLDPELPAGERDKLLIDLEDLNRRLVWSATAGPQFSTVEVKPGDTYWTVARRFSKEEGVSVTTGMLEAINKVAPQHLRAGRRLKVPREPVSLLVDKSAFQLYLLIGGTCVRVFDVGIGRNNLTPEGRFYINGKAARPPWTDPATGRQYRYGEEGHVIGSRWLGFAEDPEGQRRTGYGIHGTIEPDSIGRAASDGCIRMLNEEVEKLFDLVPEGVEVVIRG